MIHIGLYEPHDRIIKRAEDEGYSISEQIRHMIIEWGDKNLKETPAYAEAAKLSAELRRERLQDEINFKKMSNEEYGEKILRGKVRDGSKVGFRIANGQELTIPLSEIKKHTIENNGFVAVHNSILDRTFTYPGGKVPTDQEFERMLEGWDD